VDDLAGLGRQPALTPVSAAVADGSATPAAGSAVSAAVADGPVSPAVGSAAAGLASPSDGPAELGASESLSDAMKKAPVVTCMSVSSMSPRSSPGTVGSSATVTDKISKPPLANARRSTRHAAMEDGSSATDEDTMQKAMRRKAAKNLDSVVWTLPLPLLFLYLRQFYLQS
jgi:hypothetical protein